MPAPSAADLAARLSTLNSIAAAGHAIVAQAETAWPDPTPDQARMLAVARRIADRHADRARAVQSELEAAVSRELDGLLTGREV